MKKAGEFGFNGLTMLPCRKEVHAIVWKAEGWGEGWSRRGRPVGVSSEDLGLLRPHSPHAPREEGQHFTTWKLARLSRLEVAP